MLRLSLVSTQRITTRDVSYEFMNRQMVWHAFTVSHKSEYQSLSQPYNLAGIPAVPTPANQYPGSRATTQQTRLPNHTIFYSTSTHSLRVRYLNHCKWKGGIPHSKRQILVTATRSVCHLLRRRRNEHEPHRTYERTHVSRKPNLLLYVRCSTGDHTRLRRRAAATPSEHTIHHRLRAHVLLCLCHRPNDAHRRRRIGVRARRNAVGMLEMCGERRQCG